MVILILLFLSQTLRAEETRYYLVYRSSFSEFDTIRAQGTSGRRQPMQNTNLLTAPNTNYAVLQVTPRGAPQLSVLQTLEDAGRIKLLKIDEVVERMDSRTGGLIMDVKRGEETSLPIDFYNVWRSS